MFFNLLNEQILRDVPSDSAVLQYVYGEEKEGIARKVNGQIEADLQANGDYLMYKNAETNAVEEALNRAPMYLNLLKHRGYKNILFVGHYNTGQYQWILESRMDRVVDAMPLERSNESTLVDPNIVLQFLPLVCKAFAYKGEFSVVKPRESRFRGIMHSLYQQNGLTPHYVESSVQYRHGMSDVQFATDKKFDAVVFLGVPKHEDNSFTKAQVESVFGGMLAEGAEFVDLYYGPTTEGKFEGSEQKDIAEHLDFTFAVRSAWDDSVQQDDGRPEEYEIMKRTVSVY